MLLLTVWFLCAVPTSLHKGGSVQMLRDSWGPSLMAFFVVAGLVMTLKDLRRMLYAVALAVFLIILLGRFQMGYGTLANPNLLGQHLLYGLPFCLLPAMRYGVFSVRGLPAIGLAVAGVFALVATGSRASLLALVLMLLLVFFLASLANKVKLFLFVTPVVIGALLTSSSLVLTRYNTLINEGNFEEMDQETIGVTLSAIESTKARRFHLMQSLDLTIRNPIFGVGPGMFPVASAEDSERKGQRAMWKVTHNTYMQVSSETGLPGLVLYVAFLCYCLGPLIRIYRASKRQNRKEINDIAFCLLLCFAGALTCGMFASMAYAIHFPLLGALTLAFTRIAGQELSRPEAAPAGPAYLPGMSPAPAAAPAFLAPAPVKPPAVPAAAPAWRSRRYPG